MDENTFAQLVYEALMSVDVSIGESKFADGHYEVTVFDHTNPTLKGLRDKKYTQIKEALKEKNIRVVYIVPSERGYTVSLLVRRRIRLRNRGD